MSNLRLFCKILCVLLVISMLVSLVSCANDTPEEPDTSDVAEETTEAVSTIGVPLETGAAPSVITAEHAIVMSTRQNTTLVGLAQYMGKEIKDRTGLELVIETPNAQKSEKKIVIGYLEKISECVSAYNTIKGDDYAIYTEGDNVVIAAKTNTSLIAAIDLFFDKALVKEGESVKVVPYHVGFETSYDISKYNVVYADGADDYTVKTVVPALQKSIETAFGVKPKAVSDAAAPSDFEIVVGDTNRSTDTIKDYKDNIRGYYKLNDKTKKLNHGYALVSEGSKIFLLANSKEELFSATTKFSEYATADIGPKEFCVNPEPYYSSLDKTTDSAALSAGADIRVMSYNILTSNYAAIEEKARDVRVANILMYYRPDVVGLQECEEPWHNALKKLVIDTGYYAKACEKSNADGYNMTTFLYNPKTVKLVEQRVVDIVKNSNVRVLAIGVFEKLSDGSRFVVTNFHPAPSGNRAEYLVNFKTFFNLIDKEIGQYKDLPLIMTGDFNTAEQDDMYAKIKSEAGLKDAKYEANILVREYCTYLNGGPYGTLQRGSTNCIDHIFINKNAKAILFNVVIDHDVELSSDHIPIYADIDLN